MSEEDQSSKTEQPTERRLEKAVEDGNVVQSKEVGHFVVLFAVALIFTYFIPSFMAQATLLLRKFIEFSSTLDLGRNDFFYILSGIIVDILKLVLLPMGVLFVAAIASQMIQRKIVFSAKALEPDLKKLSPMKGIKRIFSLKNTVEFFINLLKLIVIMSIATFVIYHNKALFEQILFLDVQFILKHAHTFLIEIFTGVLSILFLVAIVDYLFQYFKRLKDLKMSRHEVKQENKETQGSPEIKSKRRQLMGKSRKRMLSAVKEATVIVTNPTHFAIALQYDDDTMDAPVVIAKGKDFLALKIREIALTENVPIVSNPPLARLLHKEVEIDEEIQAKHYKAVADIIRYVWGLKGRQVS